MYTLLRFAGSAAQWGKLLIKVNINIITQNIFAYNNKIALTR